jgi:hypothetical protein
MGDLTDNEKAATFIGFVKCDCGRAFAETVFRHPEKGWCCRCCNGLPAPVGEIHRHYNSHHSAPDMARPENFWKALVAAGPLEWEQYQGAVFLEICGRAGAVRDALAAVYDGRAGASHDPSKSLPTEPAQVQSPASRPDPPARVSSPGQKPVGRVLAKSKARKRVRVSKVENPPGKPRPGTGSADVPTGKPKGDA